MASTSPSWSHGIRSILSFDADFDRWPGIQRIHRVYAWRSWNLLLFAGVQTRMRLFLQSVRSLRKSPGFTIAAVLTLALGIGANTAVFSVVDAVVLRPLPYRDSDRLVMVWDQLLKLGLDQFAPTYDNYNEYRADNRVFEDIAAFSYTDLNLEGSADAPPERLEAMAVSSNLFAVLGNNPALGQSFTAGQAGAVILSDGIWRHRFGGDPSVLGRTIRLSGQAYRVQGVMPTGFGFTTRSTSTSDVWIPLPRPAGNVSLIARLKGGVTLEAAQANLTTIAAGIEAARHPYNGPHGEQAGYRVSLVPLRAQLFGSFQQGVLILAGAVVFVLLIACANVANLLLARGDQRRRELAIRTALGATRRRLLAELGAESLVIASGGAVVGVLLARWAILTLPVVSGLPSQARVAMDARVLSFTLVLSIVTAALFGLAPALAGIRGEINLAGGRTLVSGSRSRFRSALIAAEAALGVMLLAGAGLLIQSFARLERVDPGFDAHNVLTMRITLPDAGYREAASRIGFYDKLTQRLRGLPGVEFAALSSQLPLAGGGAGGDPFSIEGRSYDSSGRVPQVARQYGITPDYFRAMHIAVRTGRTIDARDSMDTPKVAVINETMARGFWPRGDAIGHQIVMGAPRPGAPWSTIAGVVADVRNSGLRTEPIPQIYMPYPQAPSHSMLVLLRTSGDPMGLALAARREIASLDPGLAAFDVRTLEQRLAGSIGRDRFQALLLGIFAIAALALAAIGIYGVLEHSVSQRTSEIGLRMALGAQRRDVMRWIIGKGIAPAILGLMLGLGGAVAVTRLLRTLLFGIAPTDPATFASAAIVFVLVALAACAIPASRALRVDPTTALRWD
jgi:putative ABC transport system permease protein